MSESKLSIDERKILLRLARETIETNLIGNSSKSIDLSEFPDKLRNNGASFVTLTKYGQLRGCIGTLEAYQPLAQDVQDHAIAAAFEDFRFPSVQLDELSEIKIEISRLSTPVLLDYDSTEVLLRKIRPGVDGIVLVYEGRKATFLPQVWEKLPNPSVFLDHLCQKMGLPPDSWRYRKLTVLLYQVEEFSEEK